MHALRRGIVVATALGLGAGMIPLQSTAAPPPTRDLATAKAGQVLPKPLKAQKKVGSGVWAAALRGPLKTNANQRVAVVAVGRDAKGRRVGPDRLRMVQHPKKVMVWARPGTRITLKLAAPATAKYRPFAAKYRLRAAGPMAAQQAKGFPVGLNAAGSPWADFFSGLLLAFTDEYFGGTASYVLGALMGSNGKQSELQPILDELRRIQGQLDDISASINDLRKDVAFAACQGQTTEAAQAVAVIQTANQRYINLVKSKETNPAVLSRWVEEVLNINSVQTSINTINNVLMGLAGTTGSLGACGQALQSKWVVPLDEDGYYQKLWNYLGFFYQAEVLGMNMLTDANHYKGAEAAKAAKQQLPPPDQMGRFLCDPRYGPPAARTWCNAALQIANIVYYDMIRQAEQAGAAYAWNTYGRGADKSPNFMAVQKGTSLAWWLDINTWKQDKSCPSPLTSKKPCGPLVGKGGLRDREQVNGFYQTWDTADSNQWAALLNLKENGGDPMNKVLESVGFAKGKTDDLIILTKDRGPVMLPGGYDRQAYMDVENYNGLSPRGSCFLDTNFPTTKNGPGWPVCGPNAHIFADFTDAYKRTGDSSYKYETSDWAKKYGTDPNFYTGRFEGYLDYKKSRWWNTHPAVAPGWLTTAPGIYGMDEYRWPVLDLNTVKCEATKLGTEKISVEKKTKGGAYTMCGNDFYWWLRYNFPLPPNPYE